MNAYHTSSFTHRFKPGDRVRRLDGSVAEVMSVGYFTGHPNIPRYHFVDQPTTTVSVGYADEHYSPVGPLRYINVYSDRQYSFDTFDEADRSDRSSVRPLISRVAVHSDHVEVMEP